MNKKDSKGKSISEAFVNSFGGYPIGYAVSVLVLPISIGWIQKDPLTANVFITLIFATVSFVRIYYLRRIFDKVGLDDNLIKLSLKLYHKVRRKIA